MEDVDLNSLQDGLGEIQADSLGDGGSNNNNNKSFVVVDFKATCWDTHENKDGRFKAEIIEFSSVLVDAATGHSKSTFHEYVIPTENHLLSEFCKNINGIKQEDVDRNHAMSLEKALDKHQKWIGRLTNGNTAAAVVVTWGSWDCRNMLSQECYRKNLVIPDYFHQWINLKTPFVERYGNVYWNKRVKEALEATGLKWEGAIKGGKSHAHNKARILSLLIRQGANLAITSQLDRPAAAPSPTIPAGRGGHDADLAQTSGSNGNFVDQQYSEMGSEFSCRETLESMSQHGSSGPCNVPLEYLRKITDNFSDDHDWLLGKGGFGTVYKGVLPNDEMIAVKKFHSSVLPGVQDKQFENEANHLMRLKHPNIVLLVGWCSEIEIKPIEYNGKQVWVEKRERLLCLEYMPKGNLRRYLSDESSGLTWETRYKIIKGICYGLHYLHEESQLNTPIIHMDLKPENILLDNNMVPKIADFGLSRLLSEEQTKKTMSRDGTLGYMAPEYASRGIISKKSDIFSLGVIIIEIVTGERDYPDESGGISSQEFTELVLNNWRNRLHESLEIDYHQIRRCIQIGLDCVKLDRSKRPTIRQVIKMLQEIESAVQSHPTLTDDNQVL